MNLPPLDLTHPAVTPDPYTVYRQYRENFPVHYLPPREPGEGARYLLTRYADVADGLKHRDLVRSHRRGQWDESRLDISPDHLAYVRTLRDWALFRDPPEHSKLRQPINRVCNELASPSFREWVAFKAEELAGTLAKNGTVDLVSAYSSKLTTGLVADLMGLRGLIPMEELDAALTCIPLVISNRLDSHTMTEASSHLARLRSELETIINRPAEHPAEARLLKSILNEAQLSKMSQHEERSMAILLLIATRDNVRNLIGNAVLNFLRHPSCWKDLQARQDGVSAAVDEVLRYEPPVQFVSRNAVKDVVIGGMAVTAGSGVIFGLAAANRDPAIFDDPERFNIRREPGKIASFGFGIHRCPGDFLARIIVEEALKVLLQCWKNPRLAVGNDQLVWQKSMVFRGLTALPLHV